MGEPKQFTTTTTPHTKHICYNQDLTLTRTTPGNTKPQTGGAFTTKPQCRQTTSSWILSSTKCVCLHSGHAITTFCVLVDCILFIDPWIYFGFPSSVYLWKGAWSKKKLVLPYNTMWTNRKKIVKKSVSCGGLMWCLFFFSVLVWSDDIHLIVSFLLGGDMLLFCIRANLLLVWSGHSFHIQ